MIFIFDSFSLSRSLSLTQPSPAHGVVHLSCCHYFYWLPTKSVRFVMNMNSSFASFRCSSTDRVRQSCLFSFVLIISRVYRSFIAVCCLFYMDLSFNIFLVCRASIRFSIFRQALFVLCVLSLLSIVTFYFVSSAAFYLIFSSNNNSKTGVKKRN